jgi:ligand-binding sensor domain-containing protein
MATIRSTRRYVCAISSLLVLALIASGRLAAAQPQQRETPPVAFERINGLSHNTVLAIRQDRQGFLWVGTADGLHRYDGYGMHVYRHDPRTPTSLVDNTVQALAVDSTGDVWVGTAGGLDRLDRTAQRFVHHDLGTAETPQSVAQIEVAGTGRVWATTYFDAQLYEYDPQAEAFQRRALGGGQDVQVLEVDARGRLWAVAATDTSGRYGVYRYVTAHDRFRRVATLPGPMLHAGPSGTIWLGGGAGGDSLDAETGPVRRANPPLPTRRAWTALHEARDGRLWIGTDRGVFRYAPSTGALQHHVVDTSGTAGLSNHVLALHEDRAGLLWVGTRSGLYRFDPHRKPFRHLGPSTHRLRERSRSAVMALQSRTDRELWVGTLGGGLVRLDLGATPNRAVHPVAVPHDEVWALQDGEHAGLWVGTTAGPCVMAPGASRCVQQRKAWADHGPAYALAEERDGTLWVGGTDLVRLDPRTGRTETPVPLAYGRDFATVQALCVDADRRLWIGMEGGGLARYHLETGALTTYPLSSTGTQAGLGSETVWTLHGCDDGPLWLGTDVGLVRLDPATDSLRHFFDAERLPGSIVYSILEDARGRLWLGTNQGLARFNPHTQQFRRYDASDGVRNTEFNRRAAARGADGRFFFGGLQGITAFDPGAIQDNPVVPPVAVTHLTTVGASGPVRRSLYGREHVVLDPQDRVFTLGYVALNFTSATKNQYAYRLDGFDDGWVDAGTRRTARYTNVPPGDYVFRVKGSNNDGLWNETGAALRITVSPPFWQTWWFRGAVLVAVVLGLGALYRARVAYLLQMERLRLRIAGDLHDDVASQLASVAISSDVLQADARLTEGQRSELQRIGRIVRRTTETLRDIVWFIDPEHDRPTALLWKMKNEAAVLLREVEYTFAHPPPDQLDALEQLTVRARRNLFLIYKEALHNAARHAHAQTVRISVEVRAGQLALAVEDDGVGAKPNAVEADGQGLKSMHRRAERMGATLEWTSAPGDGVTVRLTIPTDGTPGGWIR